MKKVKIIIVAVISMIAMLSTSCKHHEVEVLSSLDAKAIIEKDYNMMMNNCQTEAPCYFYEAQIWFDGNVDTTDQLNVVKIATVFQKQDTCTIIYHMLVNGVQVDSIERFNDYWLEDVNIVNVEDIITVDSAIMVINRIDCMKPSSNYVVLRRPLYPPFPENPYYIFGNITQALAIDAVTSEFINEPVTLENLTGVFKSDVE